MTSLYKLVFTAALGYIWRKLNCESRMCLHALFAALLIGSLPALAAPAGKSQSARSQKAHVHGAVKLGIAVDGNQAELDLDAPGEAIFGFEHAAKTSAQKSTVEQALHRLRKEALAVFGFAASASCTLSQADVKAPQAVPASMPVRTDPAQDYTHQHHHQKDSKAHRDQASSPVAAGNHHHAHADDEHADVTGRWTFVCKTPLVGTKLNVQMFKHFPRIQRLELTLVSGNRQTGKTLTKDEIVDL